MKNKIFLKINECYIINKNISYLQWSMDDENGQPNPNYPIFISTNDTDYYTIKILKIKYFNKLFTNIQFKIEYDEDFDGESFMITLFDDDLIKVPSNYHMHYPISKINKIFFECSKEIKNTYEQIISLRQQYEDEKDKLKTKLKSAYEKAKFDHGERSHYENEVKKFVNKKKSK